MEVDPAEPDTEWEIRVLANPCQEKEYRGGAAGAKEWGPIMQLPRHFLVWLPIVAIPPFSLPTIELQNQEAHHNLHGRGFATASHWTS
jgi:hypothetical protein